MKPPREFPRSPKNKSKKGSVTRRKLSRAKKVPATKGLPKGGTIFNLADARRDAVGKRLAAITENSDDAIIAKTLDGIVTQWNSAAETMFGYTADEAIGQPLRVLVPPDRFEEEVRILAGLARGKFIRHLETVRMHKRGTRIDVLATISPLKNVRGRIVGASTILRDISERKQAEIELLSTKEQLHALVERLHAVREEEGKRIARELHDDLGQHLTALNLEIFGLEREFALITEGQRDRFVRMHGQVDHTIKVVQKIASELRLGQLDVFGLTAAVEDLLREFTRLSHITCRVTLMNEVLHLSDSARTALFRILQEALTNISRHSGATEVEINLQAAADEVTLLIRDNGRGITPAETCGVKAIGLLGMRERAQIVRGDVTIAGIVGVGTTVLVRIPRIRKETHAL